MKYFLSLLFIVFFNSSALAQKATPKLDAITSIPITTLKAVESNGEIYFISQNGRYAIKGELTDTWHKRTLNSMEDIEYSLNHVNVDVMGLPIDEMNTITIPGGPERVIVFIDPLCPYCKTFIEQAKTKTDKYTFKLVVVPALGEESNQLSRSLFCASNKDDALNYLIKGKLADLPQLQKCDTKFYDFTLTIAQIFDIKSIPYLISPDGRYKSGAGKGVWDWIGSKG